VPGKCGRVIVLSKQQLRSFLERPLSVEPMLTFRETSPLPPCVHRSQLGHSPCHGTHSPDLAANADKEWVWLA